MKRLLGLTILACSMLCAVCTAYGQKSYRVTSPDGRTTMEITTGDSLRYSVTFDGRTLIAPSPISLSLSDGTVFGPGSRVSKDHRSEVNSTILPPFYRKNEIPEHYNEIAFSFRGGFGLTCRAYDDGVAYRFSIHRPLGKMPYEITAEQATFRFPEDFNAYIPYNNVNDHSSFEPQFKTSFENQYVYAPLSEYDTKRLCFLPVLIDCGGGVKVCITEADLINYPGMFLNNPDGGSALRGVFAPYPDLIEQGGHNQLQGIVKSRRDYIARFNAPARLPWRIIIATDDDRRLLDNDMVYKLAEASRVEDTSWIKPGKVAWEWWNMWNLYGVDFKTGINNSTYEKYIDFASENGIEYIILDEGWAVNLKADLMQVVPELDIPHLVKYGAERNVGIILWAGYLAFERDMERVCRHYSEMGIKGFKVDFMDRDDQPMVDFHYRAAQMAARYNLLLDIHGSYKPTGLHRTFPNVVNYEGVFGLEQMKWTPETDQVTYDLTVPFIRQLAGPMDYTQGAMRNANRHNYHAVYSEPMSQGTRCRQLAQDVIFESPLNMLCDSPSNYERERECLDFIAAIPTVWDKTVVLEGEVGKTVSIARQRDGVWYVGGMAGWDGHRTRLDLSFLGEGDYEAEVFSDGVNADNVARDYRKQIVSIPADRRMDIKMASGGGFAMKIYRR